MKFYITRHGQVLPQEFYGDVQFPAGDPPLTELGRKQASCLADYMAYIGFCGNLYVSPYFRTLETAEIIAEKTGSKIYLWAPMREIMKTQEAAESFDGMTLEKIKSKFRYLAEDAELDYPWWSKTAETAEDVAKRIEVGLQKLKPAEDALFIGHGASSMKMIEVLGIPQKNIHPYNCCLSMYDTENKKNFRHLDVAHLPYMLQSMNAVYRHEQDKEKMQELMEKGIEVSEEIAESSSLKLLHIGDTSSYTYPYYAELIQKTKPDIIIHTGDFVDEVKAGRIPYATEEYETGLSKIAKILKDSAAKEIYIVPGNNDIETLLKKYLPFATFVEPDTQLQIGGIICTLTHSLFEITKESPWYFYGHGLTGETWNPKDNDVDGICRFNAMWGAKLFLLPEKKILSFVRPD